MRTLRRLPLPVWFVALLLAACSAGVPSASPPAGTAQAPANPTPAPTAQIRPWTRLPDADALHKLLPFAIDAEAGTTTIVGRFDDGQGGVEDHPAFATSTDGSHWTRGTLGAGPSTGVPVAVTRIGQALIAVGADRCRFGGLTVGYASTASACQAAIWRSTDGAQWSRVLDDRLESAALATVIDFDGLAIAAGSRGDRAVLFTSSDGTSWEPIEGSAALDHGVIVGLASRPGQVVAIGFLLGSPGSSIPVSWSSSDGRSWTGPVRLPAPADGSPIRLAARADGFVAVGTAPRLVNGVQTGNQPLAWASTDGLTWSATPIEATTGEGQLLGLGSEATGSLALGQDSGGGGAFLEGEAGDSGWYLQPLANDLRQALGEARAVAWDGSGYLIVGAVQPPEFGENAVVLSGRPQFQVGGPLPTPGPAATNELVPGPSQALASSLDGSLALTGSVAGMFGLTGDCPAVTKGQGVLFGDGTMADGQSATIQLDLADGKAGIQIFRAGATKDSEIIAIAPYAPPTGLSSPPSGTITLAFAVQPGGTANGTLTFTCTR